MIEYLIPCTIERGGFKSERTFQVDLSPNAYVGIAYVEHFLSEGRQPLETGELTEKQPVVGFVKCRLVRDSGSNQVLVQVPDGELLKLDRDKIQRVHCENHEFVGK